MGNYWQDSDTPVDVKMRILLEKADNIERLAAKLEQQFEAGEVTKDNVRISLNMEPYDVLVLISEIVPEFTIGAIAKRILEQKWH